MPDSLTDADAHALLDLYTAAGTSLQKILDFRKSHGMPDQPETAAAMTKYQELVARIQDSPSAHWI